MTDTSNRTQPPTSPAGGNVPDADPNRSAADAVGDLGWDETRLARVALTWLVEPGHRTLGRLVREVGPVDALNRILGGAVPDRIGSAVAARLNATDPLERAAQLAAETRRLGCRLVVPEDDEWPTQLADLARIAVDDDPRIDAHTDPPLCLWVRGDLPLAETVQRSVAIVGARAATSYGSHVTTDLAFGLADRGWTVVSGGAYGIDGAAHRGALSAGGPTVAVLASGLDIVYPVGHASLFERIGTDGLLVSEWPPGSAPQRHRFLIRNRVIAALCRGTVVVEASARSGARNTARHTTALGRMLMAVPGPVTSSMSTGTNLLIRQHDARLVGSASEVLEEVGPIGELAPIPRGDSTARDQLDALSIRILDAVPLADPATVEEIAVDSHVPPIQVRRTMPMLVMLGFAEDTGAGYRLRPEHPVPAAPRSPTESQSPDDPHEASDSDDQHTELIDLEPPPLDDPGLEVPRRPVPDLGGSRVGALASGATGSVTPQRDAPHPTKARPSPEHPSADRPDADQPGTGRPGKGQPAAGQRSADRVEGEPVVKPGVKRRRSASKGSV
ncbi:DNA-processing protein DprA [Actinocatenispora rupis]|uniref:Smf/DprA SLOG domain-containing protein n=1 Tax=Actinocatenispora rupis TaxID=519421 RepID=A0A8J3N7A9_9ACTN|nr:hypothetical protein Aru02nite_00130 [Actinocatenispora rupis]